MRRCTFVVLSTTDWAAPQFGSRQQLAQRFAARGHRVLYVEVPRSLHSLVTDRAAALRSLRRSDRQREIAPGLEVYTPPPVLPHLYAPGVMALNHRIVLGGVRRALRRRGWRADLLWTYWPHTGSLVGRLGERAAVYHCIDDFVAIGYPFTSRRRLERLEAAQCRAVDVVFDRSEEVAARHRLLGVATQVLPGGVDLALFDPHRVTAPAADIAALPPPRVGLVGTLDDRLDCRLLADCARALPQVSFVLAGPVKRHRVDLRPLEACPNVHFRPSRPHSEVPAAIAALDVGLIPYRLDAATAALTPLKLYESLAMGKSVAATDLPYLRREPSGVRLARTPAELAAAVLAGLERPPSLAERAAWRAAAEVVSWDRQVDRIEDCLTAIVGDA